MVLRFPLIAGLLWLSTLYLAAQDADDSQRKTPLQLADYRWERDAQERKLTQAQIDTLKQQGFVITDKTYRQIFTPYLSKAQIFITSDSLINGYAVLLEDSVFRLERQNARRLKAFLTEAWKEVQTIEQGKTGDPALLGPATNRLKIVLGVAYSLSTGEKIISPATLAPTINEETQRVLAATGQSKPGWLGAPDPGFMAIDYTRFRPRGFYAGNPALEGYFRAVAWFQAIPFRFSKDEEFASYLLLSQLIEDRENKDLASAVREMKGMKRGLGLLVGEGDNEDPFGDRSFGWPEAPWNASLLARLRTSIAEDESERSQINDQIAMPGPNGKPERSFRVLSAHRIPDAVLYARTEGARSQDFPSGLEVAAALGSPRAKESLKASNAKLLAQIEKEKEQFRANSLYFRFLETLALLLNPVDAAAPALFHSPAWEEKSLQTFLGGWVQARHAWVLQAKQNYTLLCGSMSVPSCFAEPVPEFYNQMGQLAVETQQTFTSLEAYLGGTAEAAEQLRPIVAAWKRYAKAFESDQKAEPNKDDMALLMEGESWLRLTPDGLDSFYKDRGPAKTVLALEKLTDELAKGVLPNNPEIQMTLRYLNPTPESKWSRFVLLCLKLEALTQKQLKGLPSTSEEEELAASYGEELAGIMFYEGNSYDDPRDDAPKVVDIYTNPNVGQVLQAGIGRPRQIYVLYPYGGKEILTHGAVFPYYEFPSSARLTDKEWIDLLSSPKAPSQPDWLKQVNGSN